MRNCIAAGGWWSSRGRAATQPALTTDLYLLARRPAYEEDAPPGTPLSNIHIYLGDIFLLATDKILSRYDVRMRRRIVVSEEMGGGGGGRSKL
ncbi:hypothetical protein RR48_14694 [Papilio machaon]|uniref:Uncharacterized protein n=1 Tax=Papilio machaon TaxID=76193 RepID=A0A194QL41_PAPMA|nr:hypothetical protein RR48_14694 [Papilio machaon]